MLLRTTNLKELLALTEQRKLAFTQRPLCNLLRSGTLENFEKQSVFLACARRFSENFQTLLFLRQGLCADPRFRGVFLSHLNEEFGHDKLLAGDNKPSPVHDTLFEAMLAWFNYQMIVLDNAERAVLMHLVVEVAGDALHTLTGRQLSGRVDSGYFELHADVDADHSTMVHRLLEDLPPRNYERLATIADSGWDMMDAVMDRVFQLIEQAE